MPSVLATSIPVDHIDLHDLTIEPPRAGRAQKGFWRILAQCVAWLHARRIDRRQHLCAVSHKFETRVELFARQYPASYLLGFSSL